jgi:hypothetical protein
MTGAAEQYQYILHDESMHCNFGIDLISRSRPRTRTCGRRTEGEIRRLFERRSHSVLRGGGILRGGSGERVHVQGLSLHRQPAGGAISSGPSRTRKPVSVDEQMIDLKKERNFQTRVIDYQTGVRCRGSRARTSYRREWEIKIRRTRAQRRALPPHPIHRMRPSWAVLGDE